MANTIKIKQSSVAGKIPTIAQLELGELAVNTNDGKLFLKKNVTGTETIVEVGALSKALPSGDIVGTTDTQTLTNKTITGGDVNPTSMSVTNDILVNGVTFGLGGGASNTNLAVGSFALDINTTGFGLCAVGAYALSTNETGNYNCAVGYSSLAAATSSDNTAVGTLSGQNLTTGASNTFVGRSAGSAVTTGSSNTIIGRLSGTSGLANSILIGAGTTERARCDSSGNWGFGTTTPATRLDVNGTVTATGWSGGGIVTETATQTLSNKTLGSIKTATFIAQNTISSTSGSITIDWTVAQNQLQTEPTAGITYTFIAPPGPCHLQLIIDSDGTSTAQTINWPGTVVQYGVTWAGANNKKAVINFWYDGSTYHMIGTNQV